MQDYMRNFTYDDHFSFAQRRFSGKGRLFPNQHRISNSKLQHFLGLDSFQDTVETLNLVNAPIRVLQNGKTVAAFRNFTRIRNVVLPASGWSDTRHLKELVSCLQVRVAVETRTSDGRLIAYRDQVGGRS